LQAIHRLLQIDQTKKVFIEAFYMQGTVDDRHKELHDYKIIEAFLVISDGEIDELYYQVVLNKLFDIFSKV
jgi:SNF2 family DNA or RNA helicase